MKIKQIIKKIAVKYFPKLYKYLIRKVYKREVRADLFLARHSIINIYESFSKQGVYVAPYPDLLALTLTTRCNYNCFICDRDEYKPSTIHFENLYKLENAIKFAKSIDITGWGEPLIYPKIKNALEYIISLPGDKKIQFTSNGSKIDESFGKLLSGNINRVVFSINAATEETYNRDMVYGDFKQTIHNITQFYNSLNEEDRNKIVFSFIAHTNNFREIPGFIELANTIGIRNLFVGPFLANSKKAANFTLLNVKEEYNSIINEARSIAEKVNISFNARSFFTEKEHSMPKCVSPFTECYISAEGNLSPCCFSGNYRMGNVFETSFEDVWFSSEYYRLRQSRFLPSCENCTPYHIFDNPSVHLTGDFRVSEHYAEFIKEVEISDI